MTKERTPSEGNLHESLQKFFAERRKHIRMLGSILRQDLRITVYEDIPKRIPMGLKRLDHKSLRSDLISNGQLSLGKTTKLQVEINEPSGLIVLDEDTASMLIDEHIQFIMTMSPIIRQRGGASYPTRFVYETEMQCEAKRQEGIAERNVWDEEENRRIEPFLQQAAEMGLQLDLGCPGQAVFVDKNHQLGEIPSRFFVIENEQLKEYKINFTTNGREEFSDTLKSLMIYLESGAFYDSRSSWIGGNIDPINPKDIIEFLRERNSPPK